jgi:hypothetical protein
MELLLCSTFIKKSKQNPKVTGLKGNEPKVFIWTEISFRHSRIVGDILSKEKQQ